MVDCLDAPAFSIGTGRETSVNELARLLIAGAGRSVPIRHAQVQYSSRLIPKPEAYAAANTGNIVIDGDPEAVRRLIAGTRVPAPTDPALERRPRAGRG